MSILYRGEISDGNKTMVNPIYDKTDGIFTILNSPQTNKTKQNYRVSLTIDEDGRHVAKCLDLQGVVSDGATEREALTNIHEAIIAMLEVLGYPKDFNLFLAS